MTLVIDALILVGILVFVYGVSLIYQPAAWMVGGALLVVVGFGLVLLRRSAHGSSGK